MVPPLSLVDAPLGEPLTLVADAADGDLARRLANLGIRPGVPLTVRLRTAGGGRVVEVAGARVALGRSVLRRLTVDRVAG